MSSCAGWRRERPRVAGLTELLPEHGDATYREVLRVPALSLDGVRTPVGVGSVAYVPPRVPHRFVDVSEDLRVVVVFAPPGPA